MTAIIVVVVMMSAPVMVMMMSAPPPSVMEVVPPAVPMTMTPMAATPMCLLDRACRCRIGLQIAESAASRSRLRRTRHQADRQSHCRPCEKKRLSHS
jgi:hypothetical protein